MEISMWHQIQMVAKESQVRNSLGTVEKDLHQLSQTALKN